MYEVFLKIILCRFHKTGNIPVAAPWAYIKNNHNTDNISIEEGSVVVVIDTDHNNNTAKIFVPCGGPDPETDCMPPSVTDVKLSEICKIDIHDIPLKKSEGKQKIGSSL